MDQGKTALSISRSRPVRNMAARGARSTYLVPTTSHEAAGPDLVSASRSAGNQGTAVVCSTRVIAFARLGEGYTTEIHTCLLLVVKRQGAELRCEWTAPAGNTTASTKGGCAREATV